MAIDRNITININDTSPLANTAYVDAGKENKVYNKAQVNELVEDLREGTLGSVSPSQTLQQLNALPDGNYYASEAGTYAFGTNVPVGWQFRFNKTGTTWKVLTKVQIPMQDLTALENRITTTENKVDDFIENYAVEVDQEFDESSDNAIANKEVSKLAYVLNDFLPLGEIVEITSSDSNWESTKITNRDLAVVNNEVYNTIHLNVASKVKLRYKGYYARVSSVNTYYTILAVNSQGDKTILLDTKSPDTTDPIQELTFDITNYTDIYINTEKARASVTILNLLADNSTLLQQLKIESNLVDSDNPIASSVVYNLLNSYSNSKFKGCNLSLIGDSIGTYQNFNPSGNSVFYPREGSDVTDVNQTWWKMLINSLECNLATNDSWGSTRISNSGTGSLQTRLSRISNQTDICLINMGTNDFSASIAIGDSNSANTTIIGGLKSAINQLRLNYPNTEFIFVTPIYRSQTTNGTYTFDAMCNAMINYCKSINLKYIDARKCGITSNNVNSYTSDGLHPNKAGMMLMYKYIINELVNFDINKSSSFLSPKLEPINPVLGEIYFDINTKKIRIYNGINFSDI